MILSGPSRDFFKRRFFQNHKFLKITLYIFFMAIFPILLGILGFILSASIGDFFDLGSVEKFLVSIPFTFGLFIFGMSFFIWLIKD